MDNLFCFDLSQYLLFPSSFAMCAGINLALATRIVLRFNKKILMGITFILLA